MVHADLSVTAKHDGLHIAGIHLVRAHKFGGDSAKLVNRVGQIHPVDVSGIVQPLHVLAQAEDRRALRRLVAANTLEHTRPVTDHMRKYVDFRIVPRQPFAVVPDFFRRFDHVHSVCAGGMCPKEWTAGTSAPADRSAVAGAKEIAGSIVAKPRRKKFRRAVQRN